MKKNGLLLPGIRLALFSIAFGVMSALMGGTLNRLLVAELKLSTTLVSVFFALPLLTSFIRVWLGHYTDSHPLWGRRRESYLLLGAAATTAGIIAITFSIANGLTLASALLFALFGGFILYGVGRNWAHNMFQALLAEKLTGPNKRLITLFEVATLFGTVAGAGAVGRALETFEPARLIQVGVAIGLLFLVLSLVAVVRQEDPALVGAARQAGTKDVGAVVREFVWSDPQARLFFALVLFTFVGTLAQDVLLEPYGALVLGMSVGETTRLTAYWGVGVLVSMLISGTMLIRWLGHLLVLRIGLIASLATFIGLVALGLLGRADWFQPLVVVMGLGTGLAGAGMLTGIMAFTTPMRSGLMMGVWGMANLLGRAAGGLMGGAIVDLVQGWTGNPLQAYASVFAMEALMLAAAFVITFWLRIEDSVAQREYGQIPGAMDAALAE